MQVVSIISTKGGVGKTTTAANLGGFAADAGLRVLLLDLDVQPTLSSYFELQTRAPAGIYELLAFNEQDIGRLVSRTAIDGLDLVLSNDDRGQLNTLLLHAPDGRLRLRNLLPVFREHYDLLLIDTQGARSVLLEMAVLASDLAVSPVTPEILAAREFRRGTLQLMRGHRAVPAPRHRAAAAATAHQPRASGVQQRAAHTAGTARPVPIRARHRRTRHRHPGHRSLSARIDPGLAGASGRTPTPYGADDAGRFRHDARTRLRTVAELGTLVHSTESGRAPEEQHMTIAHPSSVATSD
jgi:hypothetical protein